MLYNAKIYSESDTTPVHKLKNVVISEGILDTYRFKDDKGTITLISKSVVSRIELTEVYENESTT